MRTVVRIAIELLVPPVLAGILISLGVLFETPADWPAAVPVFVLGAVIYGAIPILLYAISIETLFACGVRPGSVAALMLSSSLGALASVGSVLISVGGSIDLLDPWAFVTCPVLGAFVGFVVWLLIRRASN